MTLEEQLKHKIDFKTKPPGALGLLEELALQIGQIQNTLTPELKNPTLLVFAADHGLTDEGISSFPKEVTWQMVMNFVAGGAAINVFCRQNGINLKVVDAGVDFDFPEGIPVINAKIARGTRNMRREPAMTLEECAAAIQKGRELVKLEVAGGCNIIGFGEMGIGNTSASSLLMHRFLDIPIEECTGSGTGMRGEQLTHKMQILKKVSEKYDPKTPEETLAAFGGLEIGMMVGAMLEARDQQMILLIDGFIATAAALTAIRINPEVRENCVFCHSSDERGHRLMLQNMNARPMLQLNLRLGEGTGAALALPLVQAAVNFLNEMASFETSGVANKD
ncbi:MAG: nicotinate-nucleotide--dimethylbenzimidazole phosphoribosyltransferase [Bacteroidota bacterium]|nr:nicotinate-nucleotide--dimethylbenzimidazole phosphoribosyltransferase [Bacteroidota bacterium]